LASELAIYSVMYQLTILNPLYKVSIEQVQKNISLFHNFQLQTTWKSFWSTHNRSDVVCIDHQWAVSPNIARADNRVEKSVLILPFGCVTVNNIVRLKHRIL